MLRRPSPCGGRPQEWSPLRRTCPEGRVIRRCTTPSADGQESHSRYQAGPSGGKANPAPPVGPALGQHEVNIMAFCKEYNARTQDKAGFVIPVEISVFEDRNLPSSPRRLPLRC